MLKHCVVKGRHVMKPLHVCLIVLQYYARVATGRAGYVLYRALVVRGGASIFMETACNRHTDVALSPEGLGTRLAQMELHYALILRASTALVGILLQYPCTLSDDWRGTACDRHIWSGGRRGRLFWHQWSGGTIYSRYGWSGMIGGGGGGRATISVQGGLLVAGTDGLGGPIMGGGGGGGGTIGSMTVMFMTMQCV